MSTISFSGLASGIDSDALIKAMMESRRVAELPIQNKMEDHGRENTALEEFNSKLLSLRGLLDSFMTLRNSGIERAGTSSNSDAVTISTSAGSPTSNTDISVIQLAKAASFSFSDRFSSYTSPVAPSLTESGKITITVGQGEDLKTIDVDVTPGMTLTELADAMNAKGDENFHANIINAGSGSTPQYLLSVNGYATGEAKGALSVSVDDKLEQASSLNQINIEPARDSIIDVYGVGEIRRSSNEISDIIPGATISLKQVTSASVSLGVASNFEKTADKVGAVIDAINDLSSYSKSNSNITRVEKNGKVSNEYGDLGHTHVDEDMVRQFRSLISSLRSDSSKGGVSSFADLGISTQKDGSYAFDRKKFISALTKESKATNSLLSKFSDQMASSGGIIASYTQYQGIIDSTVDSNNQSDTTLQSKIDRIERSIEAQAMSMRMTYAQLEATTARMQSTGGALSSILASFGGS